jgi:hypothetical protein
VVALGLGGQVDFVALARVVNIKTAKQVISKGRVGFIQYLLFALASGSGGSATGLLVSLSTRL